VQGVRAEFEDATQLTRGCCGPEGEFLHEGRVLRADQSLEVRIECWEVGVGLDVVQGLVIAFISSVFPDMYERVAITHLRPPAPYEMYLVFRNGCHLGVPAAHELCVLIYLVWLDLVEDNGVDVFAASQDLRETAFNILVELASLGRTVYKRGQFPTLLLAALVLESTSISFFLLFALLSGDEAIAELLLLLMEALCAVERDVAQGCSTK